MNGIGSKTTRILKEGRKERKRKGGPRILMEEKGNDDNEGPSRWECWILLLLLGANYGEKGRMARGEPSECGECRVWVGTSLVSFSRSFTTRPLHHRTAVLSSVVTETRVLPIQGFPVVHCTSFLTRSLAHSFSTSLTFTGGSYNTEPLSFLSLRFSA